MALTPGTTYLSPWCTGNSDMLQKMNEIRDMQEKLTLKHFEIDQMRISQERYVLTLAPGTGSGPCIPPLSPLLFPSKASGTEAKGEASLQELTQAVSGNATGSPVLCVTTYMCMHVPAAAMSYVAHMHM